MNAFKELRAVLANSAEMYSQRREAQQDHLLRNEQFKNAVETVVLFRNRARSRADARRRNKIRNEALVTVRRTLEQATNMNANNIQTIFNVALYLLQLDQDLAYFTTDMVCAIGDRRRAFVVKHEALLLYEAAKDIPKLIGKKFRDAITALSVPADQVEVINAVSSDLNKFWRTHREFLGTIRNVLTAHREHDALAYAQALDSIEPLKVMHRAAELSQLLEILVRQLVGIGQLTSSPGTILRDIVRSNGAGAKQKRNAA